MGCENSKDEIIEPVDPNMGQQPQYGGQPGMYQQQMGGMQQQQHHTMQNQYMMGGGQPMMGGYKIGLAHNYSQPMQPMQPPQLPMVEQHPMQFSQHPDEEPEERPELEIMDPPQEEDMPFMTEIIELLGAKEIVPGDDQENEGKEQFVLDLIDQYKKHKIFVDDPPTELEFDQSQGKNWTSFSGAKTGSQKYFGHIKEGGIPHGLGFCGYMRKNYIYEGMFINGLMSGFGRFIYQDQSYYVGQMLDGQFHGQGKFYQAWCDNTKEGKWEFGSYVPENKPSEEQRQEQLQRWDAYQNQLLQQHHQVKQEKMRKEQEDLMKIDAAQNAWQAKREAERPNEVPVNFKHRVDIIMEYVQLDKLITMYDLKELVEGDDTHREISAIPPYLVRECMKQSNRDVTVPSRDPAGPFDEGPDPKESPYYEEAEDQEECGEVELKDWMGQEIDFEIDKEYFSDTKNIIDFYNQGHIFGTWSDPAGGFYGGAEFVIKRDKTWTHGKVCWNLTNRLNLKDDNNSHLVEFVGHNTMDLVRESNGEKWTLTKTEITDDE